MANKTNMLDKETIEKEIKIECLVSYYEISSDEINNKVMSNKI
tara:strand:- start:310 stop:438 length:129 start_codon:yes stop_codon:yes gene_type:complete